MVSTNPCEIAAARARCNKITQREVADALGISFDAYRKRENGVVEFSNEQQIKMMELLGMTLKQFNDAFYDGKLPIK